VIEWHKTFAACCLLGLTTIVASAAGQAAQYPVHQPVPGGIAVIEIGRTYSDGYQARFGRRPILVFERNGVWFGVVGIGLDTPLGDYLITVKTPENGSSLGFYVKPHSYPFRDDFSELGVPDDLNISLTWRSVLDASFPLISPVKGTRVEKFGSRYEAEKDAKSVQWAVLSDIENNVVVAPGGGTIVDVLNNDGINYFLTIDHGMGLFSTVGPVRKIGKETGQPVKKGEALGKLGIDTVRPHTLYWQVSLNGVAINPELVSDQLKGPEPE